MFAAATLIGIIPGTFVFAAFGAGDELRARITGRWDADTVAKLTGLIAFQNMSSKFNAALDVPPQGFCILPRTGE